MSLTIRQACEDDLPFIFHSWLTSLWESTRNIRKTVFFNNHKLIIEKLIKRSKIWVVSSPEDSGHILAWLVCEPHKKFTIVHYIYTKSPYRRMRIASKLKEMMGPVPLVSSHATNFSRTLERSWKMITNPYLLYEEL